MNDSTLSVTWWFEMVQIARKGFEVLSKGEGQVTAWRSRNLASVKKEVLAFSWYQSNHDGHIEVENQILNVLVESDLIHLESTHIYWMQPSHMLKMAMLKEKIKINMIDTLTWWRSKAMAFGLKEINSSGSNSVFIWSWVIRYAVLLRGIYHVDR